MFRKIGNMLSDRRVIGVAMLILQVLLVVLLLNTVAARWRWLHNAFSVLSYIMVVWILRKNDNPAYKIAWIIVILVLPLFGGLFYLFWGNTPANRKRYHRKLDMLTPSFEGAAERPAQARLAVDMPRCDRLSRYVSMQSGMPVWSDTAVHYYATGESMYAAMLEDLRQAKDFIFIQTFIIEEGVMWNQILEILEQKVKTGCEVRVSYDDVGCMATLPRNYDKILRKKGLRVVRFNRFTVSFNTYFNYRDHRKIMVIDGNVGYMGGINLADEYINIVTRFGYWKDTGVRLSGMGVANMTEMYLRLWEYATGETAVRDHSMYQPTKPRHGDCYVQAFDDSPLDDKNVGEQAIMQMITRANHYVYITTPYLILDNEMITALCASAESGVDVRIITPGIPDKKPVYMVTRSYYQQLVRSGVRIYEYTPGFLHAKMVVADDRMAMVGTINMDFRSFFLHFECGTLIYGGRAIADIRHDVEHIMAQSREVNTDWFREYSWVSSVGASILRVFAPLL